MDEDDDLSWSSDEESEESSDSSDDEFDEEGGRHRRARRREEETRGLSLWLTLLLAIVEAEGLSRRASLYIRDDSKPRSIVDLVSLFPTQDAFRTFFRFSADQLVDLMRHLGIVPDTYTADAPCEPVFYLHAG